MVLSFAMERHSPGSTNFIFPANFYLFGLGMLSFRVLRRLRELPEFDRHSIVRAVGLGTLAILFARGLIPGFRNYPWMHCTILFFGLPFIFQATQKTALNYDTAFGNLSYSIYVFHWPMIALLKSSGYISYFSVALGTLLLSIMAVVFVETPIDQWRRQRVASHESRQPHRIRRA